jgi:hypothetical protein
LEKPFGLEFVATWAEELSVLMEVLLRATFPLVVVIEDPSKEMEESLEPTRTAAAISKGTPKMLLKLSREAELATKA